MRISMIEPVGGHGGMNYYNSSLCNALHKSGVDVVLYTCDKTDIDEDDLFETKKVFINVYGKANLILRALRFVRALLFTVFDSKSRKADICHIHLFHYTLLEFITCFLIKFFGMKCVITVHDVEPFSSGSTHFVKSIFKMANGLIVHNCFSKSQLEQILKPLGLNTPIVVLPHGNYNDFVDVKSFADSCEMLKLSKSHRYILFFGQIKEVKGLDILINALPDVVAIHDDVKLLIAGKIWKDDFSRYDALIDKLNMSNFIEKRIGYVDDDLVDYYYSAATMVALPYKRIYQSGVLLMAMSYGCVVVASDLPPMREVIQSGINGFLFQTENSNDLSAAINNALESDNSFVHQNAKECMVESFSWDSIAHDMGAFYAVI